MIIGPSDIIDLENEEEVEAFIADMESLYYLRDFWEREAIKMFGLGRPKPEDSRSADKALDRAYKFGTLLALRYGTVRTVALLEVLESDDENDPGRRMLALTKFLNDIEGG